MDDRPSLLLDLLLEKFKIQNLNALAKAILLALLIGLGLFFRIVHLDQKIFWVDEVATVIRAVGYTKAEVISQLSYGTHTPTDLLAYQQLTPNRSLTDTLNALSHSPEHAPLYFLLTRFWMQLFGSSVTAIRSFSVVSSVLVLPCVYWFCREFFGSKFRANSDSNSSSKLDSNLNSKRIGRTAVVLMAISPFFVAYAQEARPYSLWLVTIVLTNGALLRALRLNSWSSWGLYGAALVISFYTSLLSLLLAVGQGLYVFILSRHRRITRRYLVVLSFAILAFLPWLWVIGQQQTALASNTTWMRTAIHPLAMVAIWLYSFAVLFFDVPVVATGWIAAVQAMIAAVVLSLMGYALLKLTQTSHRRGLFLAALGLPIPLTLILLDLLFRGQASATPRYLFPSQFAGLIAVAFCLGAAPVLIRTDSRTNSKVSAGRWFYQATAGILIGLSLISCLGNLNRSPDYQKARNRYNPAIAAILNQATRPILLSEPSQAIDLLSLSHLLNETVQIRILPADQLFAALTCQSVFLFNPSDALVKTLQQAPMIDLQEIYQPKLLTPEDIHLSLWATRSLSACP